MGNLFSNKIFTYTILIILSVFLMWIDVFNLNIVAPGTAITALYLIAPILLWYFFMRPKNFSKSNLSVEEKEYINKEKIKSITRSALQVLGALIAAVAIFNLKIPYLDNIQDIFQYLADKTDVAVESINTLIGIVMYLIGYFKDYDRFESRALLSPRKVDL